MKVINGHLYLYWTEIQSLGGVSLKTIDSGCNRFRSGKIQTWANIPDPEDKRKTLVAYSTLPSATLSKLPSEIELLNMYEAAEIQKETRKTMVMQAQRGTALRQLCSMVPMRQDYVNHLMSEGLTADRARQTARLAGWMQLTGDINADFIKALGLNNKKDGVQLVLDALKAEHKTGLLPPTRPITNPVVLMRKAADYLEKGLGSVVSGKFGNTNAQILTPKMRSILFGLYADGQKPSKEDVYPQFVFVCINHLGFKQEELPKIDACTKYLGSREVETAAYKIRHGEKAYMLKMRPHNYRLHPHFSHVLVAGDGVSFGSTVFIPAGHPFTRHPKTGKPSTQDSYGNLTYWLWFDDYSGAILGAKAGFSETGHMIRTSFRQILKRFDGKVPMSVHLDSKWSSKNKETATMFEQAGVFVEKKRPNNPNDSMAERLNKEVHKGHRMLDPNWITTTNTDRNFYRLNEELPKGTKPMHVDVAVEMFKNVLNLYNNRPHKAFGGASRIEHHRATMHPGCQTMDPLQRIFFFGTSRKTEVKQGGVVELTINRIPLRFDIPNWERINGMLPRDGSVRVRFDEAMPESVDLYLYDDINDPGKDRYLTTCPRHEAYTKARVLQTKEDKRILGKQEGKKKAFDNWQDAVAAGHAKALDEMTIRANLRELGQDSYKQYLNTKEAEDFGKILLDDYETEMEAAGMRSQRELVPVELPRQEPKQRRFNRF